MSNLFLTLVIAFVLIVIAISGLAIAWLITGKTKIDGGCCKKNGDFSNCCEPTQLPDLNLKNSTENPKEL